jgi:hypothetical protein
MDINKETLKKIGTLGGALKFNKSNSWMYLGGGSNKNLTKEKLFGNAGRGPLHPGMPVEQELVLGAVQSDTRKTLINELTSQTHLTREEAEKTVAELLRKGILEEVNDPNLGKVIVFKGVT